MSTWKKVLTAADITALGSGSIITGDERTKLGGIAASANNYVHPNHTGDVTSTADGDTVIGANKVLTSMIANDNVTAAKLANTINTDIATGVTANTTANAALPKAGGAMTGPITTNSTFDGVDIATRDGVLTSTTTTANAALPKGGGTMTGALTLSGAPSANLHAASKLYVDSAVSNATDNDVNNANLLAKLAALESAGGATNQNIVIGTDAGDTIVITGNLQVDGTTTTINSTTITVDDKNIVLASGAADAAALSGAGISIDATTNSVTGYVADPEIKWNSTHPAFSQWEMAKGVTGESNAFIAAMTTAASTGDLDNLTPGIGTLAMVGAALYVQTA